MNLFHNVLGYDLGYWMKRGRFNLSYGVKGQGISAF